jgi:AcrR family transcriptional regulator
VCPAVNPSGPPPRRSDDARRRLEHAAATTFADRGFHGTSTRDVAAAAGMSPAALYVHFASKEELLYRLSAAGHEATLRTLREAVASTDDPAGQLAAAVRAFVRFHATQSVQARVVNYELAHLEPAHRQEIRAVRREIDATLRAVVARGVVTGAFDVPDIRLTTVALLSLGVDVARWFRPGGDWDAEHLAERYAAIALRIVGA